VPKKDPPGYRPGSGGGRGVQIQEDLKLLRDGLWIGEEDRANQRKRTSSAQGRRSLGSGVLPCSWVSSVEDCAPDDCNHEPLLGRQVEGIRLVVGRALRTRESHRQRYSGEGVRGL